MYSFSKYKKVGLLLGPLLFILLQVLPPFIINEEVQNVISVAAWMIVWWLTEPVSISVTALIPLVLFPLFGIMDIKETSGNYGSHIVYLFFGGFVMALALEKVNLHKRIALNIIKRTGTSPDRVVLGFMLATALLSMWISNTASTVVMLPIAIQVINLLIHDQDGFTEKDQNFALSIMLAIAFSANIGGTATLIGTPPNVVLTGIIENEYGIQISFVNWMVMGIPFALMMLAVCFFVVVKWIYPSHLKALNNADEIIDKAISDLGPINKKEAIVLIVFSITILLWILRAQLNNWFGLSLSDTGISMMAALALFTITHDFNKGGFILDWKDTEKLPWGILILFGGGLALASGLSKVGFIDLIGQSIASNQNLSIIMIISLLILVMLFMTELVSNVALVAIFVPVVAAIAIGLNVPVLHVCVPVTLASSCAFMLPMATPPNAIVFASGYIKVYQMAKVGFILNIIAVALLILYSKFVIQHFF
ncbi:MAG: DASS family sodium-coupled anion symporter [Saprospiraceae bacterium]|nr:DASS family sodium-coupled anion symporter [Bacteroidia bacterium]NNL91226.1 DASS family sodium-coupled anion symporter [Saprospiraceae bacterium]